MLNGVETGVLLPDFAQQLCRKTPDVPDIYFDLLGAAVITPTLDLIHNAEAKKMIAWSVSKNECQKLQNLYMQGSAAYVSARIMVKSSNLPVSKVTEVFHSKTLYTKSTLAMREFTRMKAFARFEAEIWCLDLAQVGKLFKEINGVKYLLVRQDLFDRTVESKRMKTKDSTRRFFQFWLWWKKSQETFGR